MKWLVRAKLAPWLRVTDPSKIRAPSVSTKVNDDAEDVQQDGQQQQDMTNTTNAGNTVVPNVITMSTTDNKSDEDNESKKNDWKLAANVIDRILSIVFIILFVGGTVIFFITFATH